MVMQKDLKNNVFTSQYSRLNKAQKDAVDTIEGPVMVIAGPGTGKTSILTLRIANILRKTDTPPGGILAITYTDAGVRAMRTKLQAIIGDRAHDVRIHTFHSFASSIISEYPDHFIHMSDRKLMTDIEQDSLIRTIIAESEFADLRPSGKPDAYVSGIIRAIDTAKREAYTPDKVREFAKGEIKSIKTDDASISTRGATKGQLKAEAKEAIEKCERTVLFASVYERYEAEKIKAKRMDYNDLIIELLVSLRNDELLLRLIQEKYLYIHVDEHQDTNDAQNFIVAIIAEFFETPNIFIVGDEKQAIYRFQGASVENFLLLKKQWPAMKVISLDTNYRSHQHILDASFGMIEKNYEGDEHSDLRIHLKAGGSEKAKPLDVVSAENTSAAEMYLVNDLKKVLGGDSSVSVAIIVRRNRDLDRIIRLFESHGIPVSSERSVDIFNHPVGRLFFDLIEYIIDPANIESLSKTVISGMWNIPFHEGVELLQKMRSGDLAAIDPALPVLGSIRTKLLIDGPISFLIHAAEASGFTAIVAKDPSYVYVWRGIVALAESLAREGSVSDPRELLLHMLAYRTSAETRTIKVSVGAPDAQIHALTAHGSKGLEFDRIYIPYATEDAWIGRPKGASFVLPKKASGEGDVRDIRRLFYVAITRARKHVTILSAEEESDGKKLTPVRFIDELEKKYITEISVPRVGAESVYEKAAAVPDAKGKLKISAEKEKLLDLAKRVLTEKGLSVTALNHFIECPSKFIYQSVLKLPQAPAITAEKGTAMHDGISKVWKSEKRSVADIERILTEAVKEYFTTSLLSLKEKQTAERELAEDIPMVAKALDSHFAQKGTAHTETWVKTVAEGVPIHGKLDALIDTGDQALIYDYKAKQAMSLAAIRGETKSSDGNYFRQLIFYKMLVRDDTRWKQRGIIPALVFVSPDEKGRCPTVTLPIEDADITRVHNEIRSLAESVSSGDLVERYCTDTECEWCGMKRLL